MPHEILVEACVDSVDSAVAAETGGAHRIELCAALREGGLTPSAGTIAVTRQRTTIDIQVMIRPRGGDFLYSDTEYASMQRDVEMAKRLGSNGVVFGLLTPDGEIDVRRTEQLTEQARPMAVTFHRAFDMAGNPTQALEALVGLHIERVLTCHAWRQYRRAESTENSRGDRRTRNSRHRHQKDRERDDLSQSALLHGH